MHGGWAGAGSRRGLFAVLLILLESRATTTATAVCHGNVILNQLSA